MTPLTLAGIRANAELAEAPVMNPPKTNEPITIVEYECPVCDMRHDDYDDAAECCEEEGTSGDTNLSICPVCATEHGSVAEAVDCCLWKDFTPAQRLSIVDKREAGESWTQAIAEVTGEQV